MNKQNLLLNYIENLAGKRVETYQAVRDLLVIFHQILSELDEGGELISTEEAEPVYAVNRKELKKMNRAELLELLLSVTKENYRLQEENVNLETENTKLQQQLDDKSIILNQAGTIAEAAFQLNGVYDAASDAAQQYLDNLARLYEREKKSVAEKERELQSYARKLLEDTEKRCKAMEQESKRKADEEWKSLSIKLESFYQQHQGLKEMVDVLSTIQKYSHH